MTEAKIVKGAVDGIFVGILTAFIPMYRLFFLMLGGLLFAECSWAQLVVSEVNEGTLVRNVLVGNGIETQNIKYTGYSGSLGFFDNGAASGLSVDEGIMITTGVLEGVKGPNQEQFFNSGNQNTAGSPLLDKYATRATGDAAILEFQFKPLAKDVVFNYIFASEEYTFYVDQGVNDIFGFFISGPGIAGEQNVALIPGTSIPVAVDNVNHKRNTEYYIDNPFDNNLSQPVLHEYLQPNGFTTRLTASLELEPCEWYTIKLAIADVGDKLLDSWVFIEAGSFRHKTLIGNDTFFCAEGFKHTLNAGHPGEKVEWSTGDTTQEIMVSTFGTYWVDVYTKCGKFRDEITLRPAISDLNLGKDTFVCGNEIELTLGFKNRVFEKYLWNDGSRADTLAVSSPGKYWVEVERYGCKASDTLEIVEKEIPVFDLGTDSLYCGAFDRLISPLAADSFHWSDGHLQISRNINQPGKYILYLEKDGCHYSDTLSISQILPHTTDLGPDIFVCENDAIRLKSGILDTANYSFTWSTGETSPVIFVKESGSYSLLVRQKECGFESTDEVNVVIVEGSSGIFTPNAFSPGDADGINNVFKPIQQFVTIQGYTLHVYNLWGELLFETNDPEMGWDGTFEGELMPEGMYIWSLEIRSNCIPPEEQFKRGTLMLFR